MNKERMATITEKIAGHPMDRVRSSLAVLIRDIQNKNDKVVDSRSLESMTDGEILGAFLKPVLQSAAVKLKDMSGFRKSMKF